MTTGEVTSANPPPHCHYCSSLKLLSLRREAKQMFGVGFWACGRGGRPPHVTEASASPVADMEASFGLGVVISTFGRMPNFLSEIKGGLTGTDWFHGDLANPK